MGHTVESNKGTASGHTFMDVVIPNAAVGNPGARKMNDPDWIRRQQEYLEGTGSAAEVFLSEAGR